MNAVMRHSLPKFKQTFANLAAAQTFVASYIEQWPPEGYGTICYTDEHANGTVTVRCYRGDSRE